MQTAYVLMAIVVMGAVTFALRALPFLAAKWLRESPRIMELGRFLPSAIMVILLLHSVRDLSQRSATPYFLAELVSVVLVLVLQWFSRQPLLSILAGTGLYMVWINLGRGGPI